ncbi:MAG: hypothetical protein P8M11_10480 [Planctomycetota bacterium]|nr:hypothetical protein [Planctomycetota bacterium]
MMTLTRLIQACCLMVFAAPAAGQHCGGPCEVPRGADPISVNPRFRLVMGEEKENWRYLFNWVWTQDGTPTHRLEGVLKKPPFLGFGYRRMFVSPAGNGFLVTGNPYAKAYVAHEPGGFEPMLFIFCDPKGQRLVELPLERMLTEQERQTRPCLNCDCCKDVLYAFAEDPALSQNGCFVELSAWSTQRPIAFFLPLGLPILDRGAFEKVLAASAWARVPESKRKAEQAAIATAIVGLCSDEPDVRGRAKQALSAKGFLALSALEQAASATAGGREDLDEVLVGLRPYGPDGWEALTTDLGLLSSLLSYPDQDVVRIVHERLARIVPNVSQLAPPATITWLDEHRSGLGWNAEQGRYEL